MLVGAAAWEFLPGAPTNSRIATDNNKHTNKFVELRTDLVFAQMKLYDTGTSLQNIIHVCAKNLCEHRMSHNALTITRKARISNF